MNKKDKDLLSQKIKELDKEINEKVAERNKLKEQYFTSYALEELKEKYLDRYFVYRNNCYSCPENESDYWDVYYKPINVNEYGAIEAIRLEIDKYGEIRSSIATMPPKMEEITKEEYVKETMKIINEFMNRHEVAN